MPKKGGAVAATTKGSRRQAPWSFARLNQLAESTASLSTEMGNTADSSSAAGNTAGASARDEKSKGKDSDTSDSRGTTSSPELLQPHLTESRPGMHIIVLGASGGPREDRVSSILVRSRTSGWTLNSMLAVDAGTMLSSIIDILDTCDQSSGSGYFTDGPFKGMSMPHKTSKANAVYIFQRLISTVLISHPHLDHISALAINSPVLGAHCNPKTVAALPSVVEALKTHVFNDIIFPNLSDENGGAGLITYQRLAEGGYASMGSGDDRFYVRVSEGLMTRCFGVSHGRHITKTDTAPREPTPELLEDRSRSPRSEPPKTSQASVESSAFFIREQNTGIEIIVFGDLESDKISHGGRNKRVWGEAAPKVVSGKLRAIFIECSFSDNTEDDYLFGHLCPRHLIAELSVLAGLVEEEKSGKRKRRGSRVSQGLESPPPKSKRQTGSGTNRRSSESALSHGGSDTSDSIPLALSRQTRAANTRATTMQHSSQSDMPLSGLHIYVIHVKDDMTDGPHPGEAILQKLEQLGQAAELGCSFLIPERGESIHFE
ncbi:cAMP phosphodiesterases class-II-domain-containing protein [Aspergillus pseudoustus]|uniref:cAMP phosphodiesterases class-II-domain-containing protein n=1 Tax=Aspergillus pseudoustus TaxID=1810923 RepID=A0ABR4K055_9EURO